MILNLWYDHHQLSITIYERSHFLSHWKLFLLSCKIKLLHKLHYKYAYILRAIKLYQIFHSHWHHQKFELSLHDEVELSFYLYDRLGILVWLDGNLMETWEWKQESLVHLGKCSDVSYTLCHPWSGMTRWNSANLILFLTICSYLAPEYAQSGQTTEKADVYSFGVVLVELVTGRKAVDINRPKGQQFLTEWVRSPVHLIYCDCFLSVNPGFLYVWLI